MWRKLMSVSATRVVSYVLLLFSAGIAVLTGMMAFNSFDVLQDWKLTLPEGQINAGDRVIVASIYKKVRPASGDAVRYLECANKDKVQLRYELNRREANRKTTGNQAGGTGIDVTMRDDVPDLPAKCRISVNICYDTFLPWYCHQENQETEEFILYPKTGSSASSGSSEPQRTSQTPTPTTVALGQSSSSVTSSSSNSTPAARSSQSNTSQEVEKGSTPTSPPPAPENEPITGISLVDGVLRFLGGGN